MNRASIPRPRSRFSLVRRILLVVIAVAVVALALGGVWVRAQLRASLPVLDGTVPLAGLSAPVTIERDALGIPSIRGASREDVARATGFVHAQDRFFQMDLMRRRAAGELSALVGARALDADREIRIHRFRALAREASVRLTPHDRTLLDAYTAGVNDGLASLVRPPFEYLLLGQTPQPWQSEDTFLVILSMFTILQETDGAHEATLATMQEILPREMFELLAPPGTEWDAPVTGGAVTPPPVPGPEIYDLRTRRAGRPAAVLAAPAPLARLPWDPGRDDATGSNNWAVSGRLTIDGRPLLANDMHLSIRVPNTWYRALLEWPDPDGANGRHSLVGLTLPGVPTLVAGSNTHVAWGFTNTYADWSDIVLLDVDPADPSRYRTPQGWRHFEQHDEIITVTDGPDQSLTVRWTIWGPVIAPDYLGRPRAYAWVAHSAERLASRMTPLEGARTVEDMFDAVNGLGTPGQNIVAADRDGRIGWSIFGSIPRRVGLDGRLPASWADGTRGWDGWLEPAEYPRIVDPPSGRLWTANARVVDGEMLARLGDGGYDLGARATIIRDRLLAGQDFTRQDMLDLQLDTSADLLSRWRQLALDTLTPSAVAGREDRAAFREIVETGWSGQAAADSVAYRLAREFREQVSLRVIRFVLVECYEADPAFDYSRLKHREGPVWTLVTERPPHLLDPRYATWEDLLLSAVDAVIGEGRGSDLRERVWSGYNVAAYRHPLSAGIPLVGRWLDMPVHALPGDLFTPRVHWGMAGASQRMVVSPGREDEGLLHMPTGQSGHPLSPFFRNSHDAWVAGAPTPLLPGAARHSLTLGPGEQESGVRR